MTIVPAVLALAVSAAVAAAQAPAPPMRTETRADILRLADEAAARLAADPTDATARLDHATRLLESGAFEQARAEVAPLLDAAEPATEALALAARLAYFTGDYPEAERLYGLLLGRDPMNPRAVMGLVMTHYQTNAFARATELPEAVRAAIKLPTLDLMLAFGGETPYRVAWAGTHETAVPFLQTDPLPIVEVTVAGRTLNAIIDTGADCFILDSEIAKELGVEPVSSMMGTFAGGMQAEVGFARVDSLALGGVTLRGVPVSLLPTKPLSLGELEIGGIVGTAVLRQFLSTLDYPNGRLVLRERAPGAGEAFLAAHDGRIADIVPFYLQGTHFILAHGSLNGHEGLLFHVDTGLAGEAAFGAPEQTLTAVGIPVPEVEVRDDVVGGGGGGFAVGEFDIAELGLGAVRRHDLVGSYGAQPPGSYWRLGFIVDGLISHNFLREHAWTLDFDGMRMVATW